jgi:arylsulfatase A-like enzyme
MSDDGRRSDDERAARRELDRREFLKSIGIAAAGGMVADLGIFDGMGAASMAGARAARTRPNILVVLVDEMRFPTVFPEGITTPAGFLRKFMPNVYELWRHGVKFTNHHTAGNACSPARAAIATGLYPHQEWLLATRTAAGPSLQTAFPTYGKLLRRLGYRTPYVGKWHLSNAPSDGSTAGYLEDYGFDGMTNPDPLGQNGEGQAKDAGIAGQAAAWLQNQSPARQPYCLTVSFVNPHDRQFFWAGTEGTAYEGLFAGQALKPYITSFSSVPGQDAPPALGYPDVPPNWESAATLQANKPPSQTLFRAFQQLVWGAADDDRAANGFALTASSNQPMRLGVGVAPFSYWSRGLDEYTYVLTMVDEQVGRVIASVPKQQLRNTVIVFASDHGEYDGAHGFLAGKLGTAYEEAWHIPMIVADPSGRVTEAVDRPRTQLTSSVDFMPMLVTLGNGGSRSWMKGSLRQIYSERLDLVRLLRTPRAAGRDHLLFATDEIVPVALNDMRAPLHLLGVRTREGKLCTYSHWHRGTAVPAARGMQLEYYDYSTEAGRAEMRSTPEDPQARALARKLFDEYVPRAMQAPLPTRSLRQASRRGRESYLAFGALANAYSVKQLIDGEKLKTVLGYGLHM